MTGPPAAPIATFRGETVNPFCSHGLSGNGPVVAVKTSPNAWPRDQHAGLEQLFGLTSLVRRRMLQVFPDTSGGGFVA